MFVKREVLAALQIGSLIIILLLPTCISFLLPALKPQTQKVRLVHHFPNLLKTEDMVLMSKILKNLHLIIALEVYQLIRQT